MIAVRTNVGYPRSPERDGGCASFSFNLTLVGLGGFLGSSARFALGGVVHRVVPGLFPWGTLAVNWIGCLAIGWLGGLLEMRQVLGPGQRLFLLIGFLSGFTTFSAFAFETLGLAHDGEMWKAGLNVLAQLVGGLAAVWVGYTAAQAL